MSTPCLFDPCVLHSPFPLCPQSFVAYCASFGRARRCLALLEVVVDSLEQQRLYDSGLPYNAQQYPYTLGSGAQQQQPMDPGPGAGAREALLRVLQLMLHLLDAEALAAPLSTHHPHQPPDQQLGGAALAALVAGLRTAQGPSSGSSGDGWGDGGGSRGPWQGVGQQQGAGSQLLLLQRLLVCVAWGPGGGGTLLAPTEQVAVLR